MVGGQNMGTIPVTAWALGQIWHWSKSLSNVAEYCYQICLKTSNKVEGSLSKLLCMSSG